MAKKGIRSKRGSASTPRDEKGGKKSNETETSPPSGKTAQVRSTKAPGWNRLSISASKAKSNFAEVIEAAERRDVFITRYNRPQAVVLSIEKYEQLKSQSGTSMPAESDLAGLTREFDDMVARMQTPEAAAAVDRLFASGSTELGKAAARGAKRRNT